MAISAMSSSESSSDSRGGVQVAQIWTMGRRRASSAVAVRSSGTRGIALVAAGLAAVLIVQRSSLVGFVTGPARLQQLSLAPGSLAALNSRSWRVAVAAERNDLDRGNDVSYDVDLEYADKELSEENEGEPRYFGVAAQEGVDILQEPDGEIAEELLMPGDVVACHVLPDGSHAKLMDGRGYLKLTDGVEEVDPWAAQILKRPGVDVNDAASLAYLSLDTEQLTPLAEHLPLPTRVVKELERRGIKDASPIQEEVFDRILRGESMCLQSQTGSGKTLAMMLPLLTAMSDESTWGEDGDKIIVVTANRELAVQLFSDIDNMGFFPASQGFATMIIVGNIPPKESIQKANVIIGTPNEMGGVLHKDRDLIEQLNTKLRGIILDEVDEYTTAPKIFGSDWANKKRRKNYNEKKALLGENGGVIEYFIKRSLSYSRRKDLQVLAASATLSRPIARKVFRLLRWDPLGRWYNKPPPLVRPKAADAIDWQSVPRMATIPLHIAHRFVQVVKRKTDTEISEKHWTRKGVAWGGINRRLKIRAAAGTRRGPRDGSGQRPVSMELAASMMDTLHDTLKSRPMNSGSSMVIISNTAGITVRDAIAMMKKWGFHEAEAIHRSLWDDPRDWPSRWAIKYSYDMKDHAPELAVKHRQLNERMAKGEAPPVPVGSPAWKQMEERKQLGECTAPVMVGFEGLGRGIHFDGVDTVYIVGLPQKPLKYMHLAGRVGRLGHAGGKVVSIVPKRSVKVLDAWANQIGPGVRFEAEAVDRYRSAAAVTPARPVGYVSERQRQRSEKADEAKREIPQLTEGEEYIPVPGFAERDDVREKEMAEIRRVVKRSRQPDEVAARRIQQRLRWVTNPI